MIRRLISLGSTCMKVLHNNTLVWSFLISKLSSCVNSLSGGTGISNSGREEEPGIHRRGFADKGLHETRKIENRKMLKRLNSLYLIIVA